MEKELLTKLRAIEVDKTFITPDDPELVFLSNDNEMVHAVVMVADKVLISDNGHPNWDAITVLQGAGFPVFQGERDGFGWLSGYILTRKGIIVFG